jgi:AraC-like DNA-binding protein
METENIRKYTKSQAELAEQASTYMLEHMDKKITIYEISEMLHVSQTQLKNSFRNYYGESVYKYIRSRKMQQAAVQLEEGKFSVMEIAGMYGYENCSKFAAAFRKEYGLSPSSYRKQHRVRNFPAQLPNTSQEQHLA